jgi:starvation-inducible DNA-binding protein
MLAEYLRQLGQPAPGSLSVYSNISEVKDEEGFPSSQKMFQQFLVDNQIMINLYQALYDAAEATKDHQISNYAADRLGAHKKHAWMVNSILKA